MQIYFVQKSLSSFKCKFTANINVKIQNSTLSSLFAPASGSFRSKVMQPGGLWCAAIAYCRLVTGAPANSCSLARHSDEGSVALAAGTAPIIAFLLGGNKGNRFSQNCHSIGPELTWKLTVHISLFVLEHTLFYTLSLAYFSRRNIKK